MLYNVEYRRVTEVQIDDIILALDKAGHAPEVTSLYKAYFDEWKDGVLVEDEEQYYNVDIDVYVASGYDFFLSLQDHLNDINDDWDNIHKVNT